MLSSSEVWMDERPDPLSQQLADVLGVHLGREHLTPCDHTRLLGEKTIDFTIHASTFAPYSTAREHDFGACGFGRLQVREPVPRIGVTRRHRSAAQGHPSSLRRWTVRRCGLTVCTVRIVRLAN